MFLFKALFYAIVPCLFLFIGKADSTCADGGDYFLAAEDEICTHDKKFIVLHSGLENPKTFEECSKLCLKSIDCKYFSYGSLDVTDEAFQGACIGCSEDAEFKRKGGFDTYEICEDDTPVVTRNVKPKCLSSGNMISLDKAKYVKESQGLMKFTNVGTIDGKPIDLMITVEGGNNRITGNGFKCDGGEQKDVGCETGSLGTINSKPDNEAIFLFKFIDPATGSPVTVPAFHFSVFDIDQSKKVLEQYTISEYESAVYDETNSEATFKEGELTLKAKSKKIGHGCDNPSNPNDLGVITNCYIKKNGKVVKSTVNRGKRSFAVLFKNKSEFKLTWSVPWADPCIKGKRCRNNPKRGGRNFLFGFKSGMDCEDEDECTDGMDCEDEDECTEESVNALSLKDSTIDKSYINATQGIVAKYENVGKNKKKEIIDLEVRIKKGEEYDIGAESGNGFRCDDPENPKAVICEDALIGSLNLRSNMETIFVLVFKNQKTKKEEILPSFHFTIFDLDQSGELEEYVEVSGYETATYEKDTGQADFTENINKIFEKTLSAKSTQEGKACDNPKDPDTLINSCVGKTPTPQTLKQRSFMVTFKEKSKFELKFKNSCLPGQEEKKCNPTNHDIGGGRNLLFSFSSIFCPSITKTTSAPIVQTSPPTSPPSSLPSSQPSSLPSSQPSSLPSSPPSSLPSSLPSSQLSSLPSSPPSSLPSSSQKCGESRPVSICIALDNSGSICMKTQPSNLKRSECAELGTRRRDVSCDYINKCPNADIMKNFATGLFDMIDENSKITDAKYAVVRFGRTTEGKGAEVIHELSGDVNATKNALESMKYLGGKTPTKHAIEACQQELEKGGNEDKFLVLVTDGPPYFTHKLEQYIKDTTKVAQSAKEDGIKIVTVAAGVYTSLDEKYLKDKIASSGLHTGVGNFNRLVKKIGSIVQSIEVCEEEIE